VNGLRGSQSRSAAPVTSRCSRDRKPTAWALAGAARVAAFFVDFLDLVI
jgi:hypothetical protein